jgi:hypothetical protein
LFSIEQVDRSRCHERSLILSADKFAEQEGYVECEVDVVRLVNITTSKPYDIHHVGHPGLLVGHHMRKKVKDARPPV